MIEIEHPLYNYPFADGARKAVGVAEWRIALEDSVIQVKIKQLYHSRRSKKRPVPTEKDGSAIYPTIYCIRKSEIGKFPQEMAGDGKTVLRIIPLDAMYPKKFDIMAPQVYANRDPVVANAHNETCQGKLF